MFFLNKIFGTKNDRDIKKLQPIITRINDLEPTVTGLSDEDLAKRTIAFRERIANGEDLDALIPETFATVREASKRVHNERHFDVQLVGGIALHEGKISEMKTGEGKTLTATLALYLNALTGKPCQLVTVNDYLAERDAKWMGEIYKFLGMSVGSIRHGLTDQERSDAYGADITYGTNNEFGFDYLRDNMKTDRERMVQRGHYFAIVDEVDSILIDEARTPLIISGPSETNTEMYGKVNATIPGLQKDSDYVLDEKSRTVSLTEDGISKLEKRLRVENLYDPTSIEYLHHVNQSLKAHIIFKKDVDYVVRDRKVIIIDEFTGRMMPGRRFSDGLHGALEAKEHVAVQTETQTLASITFQNYFRLYDKLAGMTGTAETEALEFQKIYGLEVLCVPTNAEMIRDDQQDEIYRTAKEKFNKIADEIASAQKRGQPVLVGTVSVEKSELLSSLLKKRKTSHEILNAKNHGREAEIISSAGKKGRVTISTNMAGRGTDIVLGEGVREIGGLYVIGTERHESRRVDNQLRGRSGRQGDKGVSKFFLSLEDDLMRIFASDKLSGIMNRLGMEEGEAIVSPMVTRAIARAQKRVEEQNFSSRKHLLEYDDVMNQQRQVIYEYRNMALDANERLEFLEESALSMAEGALVEHSPESTDTSSWDFKNVAEIVKGLFHIDFDLSSLDEVDSSLQAIAETATEQAMAAYKAKIELIGEENMIRLESWILLQIVDKSWKNHLLGMDSVKDSVSLRGYGQRDPLQEYKKEGFRLFSQTISHIKEESTTALIQLEPPEDFVAANTEDPDEESMAFQHPNAQKTYAAPQQDDSKMVYHGSRSEQDEPERQQIETFKRDGAKVGRNDPCPCGSGKKYKKCCGRPGAQPAT